MLRCRPQGDVYLINRFLLVRSNVANRLPVLISVRQLQPVDVPPTRRRWVGRRRFGMVCRSDDRARRDTTGMRIVFRSIARVTLCACCAAADDRHTWCALIRMTPRGSILCRIIRAEKNELQCRMARICVVLRLFGNRGIAMPRVFHGIRQAWSTRPPR